MCVTWDSAMLRLRVDYLVTYLYFSDGAFPKAQDSIPQVVRYLRYRLTPSRNIRSPVPGESVRHCSLTIIPQTKSTVGR